MEYQNQVESSSKSQKKLLLAFPSYDANINEFNSLDHFRFSQFN